MSVICRIEHRIKCFKPFFDTMNMATTTIYLFQKQTDKYWRWRNSRGRLYPRSAVDKMALCMQTLTHNLEVLPLRYASEVSVVLTQGSHSFRDYFHLPTEKNIPGDWSFVHKHHKSTSSYSYSTFGLPMAFCFQRSSCLFSIYLHLYIISQQLVPPLYTLAP